MGLSVLDTDRGVWPRPCVKHKQARAWPELKEAPRAARGQGVNPLTKKKVVGFQGGMFPLFALAPKLTRHSNLTRIPGQEPGGQTMCMPR